MTPRPQSPIRTAMYDGSGGGRPSSSALDGGGARLGQGDEAAGAETKSACDDACSSEHSGRRRMGRRASSTRLSTAADEQDGEDGPSSSAGPREDGGRPRDSLPPAASAAGAGGTRLLHPHPREMSASHSSRTLGAAVQRRRRSLEMAVRLAESSDSVPLGVLPPSSGGPPSSMPATVRVGGVGLTRRASDLSLSFHGEESADAGNDGRSETPPARATTTAAPSTPVRGITRSASERMVTPTATAPAARESFFAGLFTGGSARRLSLGGGRSTSGAAHMSASSSASSLCGRGSATSMAGRRRNSLGGRMPSSSSSSSVAEQEQRDRGGDGDAEREGQQRQQPRPPLRRRRSFVESLQQAVEDTVDTVWQRPAAIRSSSLRSLGSLQDQSSSSLGQSQSSVANNTIPEEETTRHHPTTTSTSTGTGTTAPASFTSLQTELVGIPTNSSPSPPATRRATSLDASSRLPPPPPRATSQTDQDQHSLLDTLTSAMRMNDEACSTMNAAANASTRGRRRRMRGGSWHGGPSNGHGDISVLRDTGLGFNIDVHHQGEARSGGARRSMSFLPSLPHAPPPPRQSWAVHPEPPRPTRRPSRPPPPADYSEEVHFDDDETAESRRPRRLTRHPRTAADDNARPSALRSFMDRLALTNLETEIGGAGNDDDDDDGNGEQREAARPAGSRRRGRRSARRPHNVPPPQPPSSSSSSSSSSESEDSSDETPVETAAPGPEAMRVFSPDEGPSSSGQRARGRAASNVFDSATFEVVDGLITLTRPRDNGRDVHPFFGSGGDRLETLLHE